MKTFNVKSTSQIIFISIAFGLIWYILLSNFGPFGLNIYYAWGESDGISELTPSSRVQRIDKNGEKYIKQNEDLVYFTTKMPIEFDTATIRITFSNSYIGQDVLVGYKDREEWHYGATLIDSPALNTINWRGIGENPTLYGKDNPYNSFQEFLKNPPKNALVGTYKYDPNLLINSNITLPNYKPSTTETIINTPLRGKHVIYAYLNQEPFIMRVIKQDLNWYEDPDPLNINIYKDEYLLYSAYIADDGITNNSKKSAPPQEIEMKNPGPELPESGIYKIVIDASTDVVIKKISTNLHKLVFETPIFSAGNKEVYPGVIEINSATTLFTNALALSTVALHDAGLQKILIGKSSVSIDNVNEEVTATLSGEITKVHAPKSDVLIKGYLGYFAFSENQFFNPSPYRVIPVTNIEDLALLDYVVAEYKPPQLTGEWKIAEHEFDLTDAKPDQGTLSWVINAPGLKENDRSILIKDIEIKLHKKPLPVFEKLRELL